MIYNVHYYTEEDFRCQVEDDDKEKICFLIDFIDTFSVKDSKVVIVSFNCLSSLVLLVCIFFRFLLS